jgi:peptidoglycan/LPS O-acetylase OafA/YrhL
MSAPRGPSGAHLAHVDGLRGCAALFVMLHHMFQTARSAQYPEIPRVLVLFQYGHFAVSLFIVISGFSLMLQVVRSGGILPHGAWGFYKRRARRILPPYYAAMVLSLVLIAVGYHTFSVPLTPIGILAHVFLLQDVVVQAKDQVNFVFWSIAVESQIYVVFPLLIVPWRRGSEVATILACIVLPYVAAYPARNSRFDGMHLNYVALFAMGMATAAIYQSDASPWKWLRERVPWSLIAAGAAAIVVIACNSWQYAPGRTLDLAIGVLGVSLIVGPSRPENRVQRAVLSWKPLVFAGTFAYSIYLIHTPLLGVASQSGVVPRSLGPYATFAFLVFVASWPILLGCYLFFLVFERPVIRSPGRRASHAAVTLKPQGATE